MQAHKLVQYSRCSTDLIAMTLMVWAVPRKLFKSLYKFRPDDYVVHFLEILADRKSVV